jgi:hypothetical protein
MCSFVKLLAVLVLFVIPPTVLAVGAQPIDSDPACPGLKLEIAVPDDVIRPQSNVLLEMKLTNVTRREISLSSDSTDFWSYEFELRDAKGAPVPRTAEWMRALSERPTWTTVNVGEALAVGASLIKTVMLEKLFDLSKPGQYTLRISFASFACSNSGTRVTSNLIHFTVDAPSNRPSTSQAGISITTSAKLARLPVGWGRHSILLFTTTVAIRSDGLSMISSTRHRMNSSLG